ncbi:MAG: transposase, partial [Holophagae bacterium]
QGVGLLSQERTELLLSWRHTGFSVHNRVRVEPEEQLAVERLARDIMRPPISLERMVWDGEGKVRYRRKRGHESSGLNEREVEAFDLPESSLVYCDDSPARPTRRRNSFDELLWYSNVSRGKRRKAGAENGDVGGVVDAPDSRASRAEVRDARAMRRSWAQLIKRIYEVDPLVCPSCGSEMKVIAFITEHDVIDAILRHLERKESQGARAPPN